MPKLNFLSIGFGIEKLGLYCLRTPFISLIIIISITIFAAYASTFLKIEDRISAFFESDRARYQQFQTYLQNFPSDENDLIFIFKSENGFKVEQIENLRWYQIELNFEEGINSVLSVFTFRIQDGKGGTKPIIPDPLPDGLEVQSLLFTLKNEEGSAQNFISKQANSLLFVIKLNQEAAIESLIENANQFAQSNNMDLYATGAPLIRTDISKTVAQDRVRFNILGFLFGLIISIFVFRNLKLVILSATPALFSAIWTIGYMSISGHAMNMLSTVIPAFVMVISYADSIHMLYAIKRRLAAGMNGTEAAKEALRAVGPACVLTSITTGLAVITLTLTSSNIIKSFGWMASIGALFALISVLTIVPILSAIFFSKESVKAYNTTWFENFLSQITNKISIFVISNYKLLCLAGLLLTIGSLLIFSNINTNYRVKTNIPDGSLSKTGLAYLNENYEGQDEIVIILEGKDHLNQKSQEYFSILKDIETILNAHARTTSMTSILDIHESEASNATDEIIAAVTNLPENIQRMLINEQQNMVSISVRFKTGEDEDFIGYIQDIEEKLLQLSDKNPEFKIMVTGTSVLTTEANHMLHELRNSIIMAFMVAIIIIGIAFRSFKFLLLAIIPNILPLSFAGVYLLVSGWQFEFASAMAMTVALGIAVDDTIHMIHRLNREWAERKPNASHFVKISVQSSIKRVGSVILLATIILVCGISVTLTSDMPTMRIFGITSIIVLLSAMITDLLFLPAFTIWLSKYVNFKSANKFSREIGL